MTTKYECKCGVKPSDLDDLDGHNNVSDMLDSIEIGDSGVVWNR